MNTYDYDTCTVVYRNGNIIPAVASNIEMTHRNGNFGNYKGYAVGTPNAVNIEYTNGYKTYWRISDIKHIIGVSAMWYVDNIGKLTNMRLMLKTGEVVRVERSNGYCLSAYVDNRPWSATTRRSIDLRNNDAIVLDELPAKQTSPAVETIDQNGSPVIAESPIEIESPTIEESPIMDTATPQTPNEQLPVFSVLQENLLAAIRGLFKVIPNRIYNPAHAMVVIRAKGSRLIMFAYDGESVQTAYCGAKVDIPGVCLLPARTLYDLVPLLSPERIDFRPTNYETLPAMQLACGATRCRLVSKFTLEDFPELPDTESETGQFIGEIGYETLQELMVLLERFSTKDSDRALETNTDIIIESDKIRMMTTDGYSLAQATIPLDSESTVAPIHLTTNSIQLRNAIKSLATNKPDIVGIHWIAAEGENKPALKLTTYFRDIVVNCELSTFNMPEIGNHHETVIDFPGTLVKFLKGRTRTSQAWFYQSMLALRDTHDKDIHQERGIELAQPLPESEIMVIGEVNISRLYYTLQHMEKAQKRYNADCMLGLDKFAHQPESMLRISIETDKYELMALFMPVARNSDVIPAWIQAKQQETTESIETIEAENNIQPESIEYTVGLPLHALIETIDGGIYEIIENEPQIIATDGENSETIAYADIVSLAIDTESPTGGDSPTHEIEQLADNSEPELETEAENIVTDSVVATDEKIIQPADSYFLPQLPEAENKANILSAFDAIGFDARHIYGIFEYVDIAEKFIEDTIRQQPHRASDIWDTFKLLQPSTKMMKMHMKLYDSHIRELMQRILNGEDLKPATRAEILIAMSDVASVIPIHNCGAYLFSRLFKQIFGAKHPTVTAIDSVKLNEPYAGAADEMESELRHKLRDDNRHQPDKTRWAESVCEEKKRAILGRKYRIPADGA